MKLEVASLKEENQKLKTQNNKDNKIENANKTIYETDEEEVAAETGWIVEKRKSKKRKAESSPEIIQIIQPISTKKLEKNVQNNAPQLKVAPKPPPIMVSNISNYINFNDTLKKKVKGTFSIKMLNNGVYKINVLDSTDYRAVTKALNNNDISWYSYQDKQARPIQVIVKNLHHSWDTESIVSEFKSKNLKAISAVNKWKYKTKEPLDMFLVTFDSSEDINKIFEVKLILNTVVKIEPTKRSKLIPQCKICQGYGHTKNYCSRPPRCVKCAGKHNTNQCVMESTAKCANCGEKHPANYRGCMVAKELQKMRKKSIAHSDRKNTMVNQQVPKNPQIQQKTGTTVHSNRTSMSYADITRKGNASGTSANNDILLKILSKLEDQEYFYKQLEERLEKLEINNNRAKKNNSSNNGKVH